MKKYRCSVCGYIHTGEHPPDACPVCYAPADKFEETDSAESTGLAGYLEANIKGETWEVTHYMAMALKAQALGLAEVAETLYRIASEEAYHGANFIHRGSKVDSVKSQLDSSNTLATELKDDMQMMYDGEIGAHKGKNEAASLAKAEGHDELAGFFKIAAEDESRHASMLKGLLEKYFK